MSEEFCCFTIHETHQSIAGYVLFLVHEHAHKCVLNNFVWTIFKITDTASIDMQEKLTFLTTICCLINIYAYLKTFQIIGIFDSCADLIDITKICEDK